MHKSISDICSLKETNLAVCRAISEFEDAKKLADELGKLNKDLEQQVQILSHRKEGLIDKLTKALSAAQNNILNSNSKRINGVCSLRVELSQTLHVYSVRYLRSRSRNCVTSE